MANTRPVVVSGTRRTTGVDAPTQSNERDELFVAWGLPPYTEMTRKGQSWSLQASAALAALIVRPTTVAGIEIYNANIATGPSLIIDRIFAEWRISTAVAQGAIQFAMVYPKAAPTAGALVTRGNSGKAYGGAVISAVGTTVVDNGWFPWGPALTGLGAATPLGGLESRVEGRLIVPPGSALLLHVVASVVGNTFIQGASWFEETIATL